jgi:hypothetical protein
MDNNYFFLFSYQEWSMATCLEIIEAQLNYGNAASLIDLTGKYKSENEFPIADRLKLVIVGMRLRKSKIYLNLLEKYEPNFKVLEDKSGPRLTPSAILIALADEVAYLELIAVVREAEPSRERYSDRLCKYRQTFLDTYFAASRILNTARVDRVYLYNGRFLQERAVWEVCRILQIPVVFYEKFNPSWKNRYFLFENPTHSPSYRSSIMLDFGRNIFSTDIRRYQTVGNTWFENRMLGKTQDYTSKQNNLVQHSFTKPFVVFFHSSEDELITTDLQSKTWGNQISALNSLVEVLEEIGGKNLIIRAHPNLLHKSANEIGLWKSLGARLELEYPWITFVDSESDVSSYQLIMDAESVVTVGSTIGVEAAYWGKKSILMGRAFHEDMGITMNPENKVQLRELIELELNNEDLETRKFCALDYAVFHDLGGTQFSSVVYRLKNNRDDYRFMGFVMRQPRVVSLLMRLDSFLRKVLKNAY